MRVLLVYNESPEELKFYAIVPTDKQVAVLELAQGRMVNYDMPKKNQLACDKITQAVTKPEHLPADDDDYPIYKDWASIWVANKIDERTLPILGPWDRVYSTGFAM